MSTTSMGRTPRQAIEKALCSFQALQTDKLDDRRPAEMAARFGETPEPTVGLVGHSQVRQPAEENALVKQGNALLPLVSAHHRPRQSAGTAESTKALLGRGVVRDRV